MEYNKGVIMKKLSITLILMALLMSYDIANAGHFSLANKSMIELQLSGRNYQNNDFETVFQKRDSFTA